MKIIHISTKQSRVFSLTELIKAAIKEGIGELSAGMAYRFLFGIFPIVIFIGCLVGRFELFSNTAELFLKGILPQGIFEALKEYLLQTDTAFTGEATGALGLSLYSGIRITHNLKIKLNSLYGFKEKENTPKAILKTAVFSLMIPASTVVTLFVLVSGEGFFSNLEDPSGAFSFFIRMWLIFRFVLVWFFLLAVFFLIYCYLPSASTAPAHALKGACFSSFSWVLMCVLFSFYVDNLHDYSSVYGSLGAVMVLLLWIYLTCYVLLLGALLTSKYAKAAP